MHYPVHLILQIRCKTAFSLDGYSAPQLGADKAFPRNAEGLPVIPGSTIKGGLREHTESLLREFCRLMGTDDGFVCRGPAPDTLCPLPGTETLCPVCRLFGSPWAESRLVYHDATLLPLGRSAAEAEALYRRYQESPFVPPLRTMVAVSRKRGVAQEQQLRFIETSEPGRPLTFYAAIDGSLEHNAQDQLEAPPELILLHAAIDTITRTGGERCRGLGSCEARVVVPEDFAAYCREHLVGALLYLVRR